MLSRGVEVVSSLGVSEDCGGNIFVLEGENVGAV